MKNISRFLITCILLCPVLVRAQEVPVSSNSPWAVLLQGEQRKISSDLIAYLEGDQLEIVLRSNGLVDGPKDEYLVSLVQPNGDRIDQRPDENGRLAFAGVQQGLAALVITADTLTKRSTKALYAAIPFYMAAAPAGGKKPVDLPLAMVNSSALRKRIDESTFVASDEADVLPQSDFDTADAGKLSRFQVMRAADRSVTGQVLAPQLGYTAMPGEISITFTQGEKEVTAKSDKNGNFELKNVPLGLNSMVAMGMGGHVAHLVEVVEFKGVGELKGPTTGLTNSRLRFVANQVGAAESMLISLIPPALMDEVKEILDDRLPDNTPTTANNVPPGSAQRSGPTVGGFAASGTPISIAGGGLGGGASGGGAGLGGGGGALGAAALAVAAAALANDDGGFNANASSGLTP